MFAKPLIVACYASMYNIDQDQKDKWRGQVGSGVKVYTMRSLGKFPPELKLLELSAPMRASVR